MRARGLFASDYRQVFKLFLQAIFAERTNFSKFLPIAAYTEFVTVLQDERGSKKHISSHRIDMHENICNCLLVFKPLDPIIHSLCRSFEHASAQFVLATTFLGVDDPLCPQLQTKE